MTLPVAGSPTKPDRTLDTPLRALGRHLRALGNRLASALAASELDDLGYEGLKDISIERYSQRERWLDGGEIPFPTPAQAIPEIRHPAS